MHVAAAEHPRQCTIQAVRTDEEYSSLVISQQLGTQGEKANKQFNQYFPAQEDADYDISYHLVTDVTIDIDGQQVALEEAIAKGSITVEEIIADVRRDVVADICKEFTQTQRGWTQFIYCYSDFQLEYCNDIYQTPDGKEHLIRYLNVVYPHDTATAQLSTTIYDMSTPYHYPIDMEDWGLEFSISAIDEDGFTLNITQSGGQQFGQLMIENYVLLTYGNWQVLSMQTCNPKLAVTMSGNTEIRLSWEDLCFEPIDGKYCLTLSLLDQYSTEAIHPLAIKYHDVQNYYIEFQISQKITSRKH